MLKSKGLVILAMLAVFAPHAGHAFPNFHHKNDMLKLLFSAAEDVAVQGDVTKRTNVKLSDGKTYLITFTKGEKNAGSEDGIFGASLIPTIMKDSDAAKISSLSAFKRLLKFQERLLDDNKKDVGELSELGVLYNSPFVTEKTTEELKAVLKEFEAGINRAKLQSEDLKLALKQLIDLYKLKNSSHSEEGFHFVNKVGTHEGKVQKYVLKIRQFNELVFQLTRVKTPASGGGNTDNTHSDATFAIITTTLPALGFSVINDLTDSATISVAKVNFGARTLDAQKARLNEVIAGYSTAKTESVEATAAGEPNAASAASVLQNYGNVIAQFVTQYNAAQTDDTQDITFTP